MKQTHSLPDTTSAFKKKREAMKETLGECSLEYVKDSRTQQVTKEGWTEICQFLGWEEGCQTAFILGKSEARQER